MRVLSASVVAALAACYRPAIQPCQYACDDGACPDGLACNAAGFCAAQATDVCSLHGDGGPPDSPLTGSQCWTAPNLDMPCAFFTGASSTTDWDVTATTTLDTACPSGMCGQPPGVALAITVQDVMGHYAVVLAMHDFTVEPGVTLTVTPTYPVILLVYGSAQISGTIAIEPTMPGSTGCNANSASPDSACGGGGGGFGAAGGAGGGDTHSQPASGGAAGSGLRPLVAGCAGGQGGAGGAAEPQPGGGGNAFEISANGHVEVDGMIAAPGAGGQPVAVGIVMGGGGGGGAGGGIWLDGATIGIGSGGAVCATGGGGGGGGDSGTGGGSGQCPRSGGNAGEGGTGGEIVGGAGGIGGYGSGSAAIGADGASTSAGGGGGGGGVGIIEITTHGGGGVEFGAGAVVDPPPDGLID